MRPGPLKSDDCAFAALANRLVPLHGIYLALGLHLVTRPDFTTDGQGHVTCRFVYRGKGQTVTHVVKRVHIQWA